MEPKIFRKCWSAKSNATTLYNAAVDAYRAAEQSGAPPFWIASSSGFTMTAKLFVALKFGEPLSVTTTET